MLAKENDSITKKIFAFPHIFVTSLFVSDILSSILAFLITYFLRDKGFFRIFLDNVQPITVYLQVLPFAVIALIVVFSSFGLYEPKQRKNTLSEMYKIFQAMSFWILLIMAGSYLSKTDYSRIIVIMWYIWSITLIILGRIVIRHLQRQFQNYGFGRINIAIIGNGRQAREISNRILKYKDAGLNFVGFIVLENHKKNESETIGSLKDIQKLILSYKLDEIYIAEPMLSHENILTIITKCSKFDTKFKITSNVFDLITGFVDIADLENIPSLDLSRAKFPLWKTAYKRIFDIIFSLFGIIITSPLWLAIIVAIKLDSEGPAILRQKRTGKNVTIFYMYKFRTMAQKTPLYRKAPTTNADSRVTFMGRILRKTSLDELPQLINVLLGDMSIVGPRPEMPHIVKRYKLWEKRRLVVKPGLTGLWQILGRKDLPLAQNLEYDFYYINNQSFFLDIIIILKTIPVVIKGKGAY